jgi:hypothetical protein
MWPTPGSDPSPLPGSLALPLLLQRSRRWMVWADHLSRRTAHSRNSRASQPWNFQAVQPDEGTRMAMCHAGCKHREQPSSLSLTCKRRNRCVHQQPRLIPLTLHPPTHPGNRLVPAAGSQAQGSSGDTPCTQLPAVLTSSPLQPGSTSGMVPGAAVQSCRPPMQRV